MTPVPNEQQAPPSAEAHLQPLSDILAITDRDGFRSAVSAYIFAKHAAHGWDVLTPFECMVFLALEAGHHEVRGTLLDEGLRSRERCAQLVAVLEQIGARQAADALSQAQVHAAKGSLQENDREEAVARMVDGEVAECIVAFVNERRHMLRPD